jgi:hypothetical protein
VIAPSPTARYLKVITSFSDMTFKTEFRVATGVTRKIILTAKVKSAKGNLCHTGTIGMDNESPPLFFIT